MLGMDQEGWKPDLVVAHPSWGEALFVRDLWPRAKLLCYLEFYYAAEGRDVIANPHVSFIPRGESLLSETSLFSPQLPSLPPLSDKALAALPHQPLAPWDAVICTSRASKAP